MFKFTKVTMDEALLDYSKPLKVDLKEIMLNSKKPASARGWRPGLDVTFERIYDLYHYLSDLVKKLTKDDLERFFSEGLNCFKDFNLWSRIEQALFSIERIENKSKRGGSVITGLWHLIRVHQDNEDLLSPSKFKLNGIVDTSKLYIYPLPLIFDFHQLAVKINKELNGSSRSKSIVQRTLNAFHDARFTVAMDNIEGSKELLTTIINSEDCANEILSQVNKSEVSRVKTAFKIHSPDKYGKVAKSAPRLGKDENVSKLTVGDKEAGAHWLNKLSPLMLKQCQQYLDFTLKIEGQKKANSELTRLLKFTSNLYDIKDSFEPSELRSLDESGCLSFLKNSAKMWLAVYDKVNELHIESFSQSYGILESLISFLKNESIRLALFQPYQLAYPNLTRPGEIEYRSIEVSDHFKPYSIIR